MGDILVLGGVVFNDFPFATPDAINEGSGQLIAEQKLIGGDRVLDAMGPDPEPIEWTGRWRDASAVGNDQLMVAMAEAGAAVPCTWNGYFFTVLIERYKSKYESYREIVYTVKLCVLPNNGGSLGSTSLDDIVGQDLSTALGAGSFL